MPIKNVETRRRRGAERQAAFNEREKALGRIRRGYYATLPEHESLATHLRALRTGSHTLNGDEDGK